MAAPYTELNKPGKTLAQKILRRPNKGDAFDLATLILGRAIRDVNS